MTNEQARQVVESGTVFENIKLIICILIIGIEE
jgi:hypothetical protein